MIRMEVFKDDNVFFFFLYKIEGKCPIRKYKSLNIYTHSGDTYVGAHKNIMLLSPENRLTSSYIYIEYSKSRLL